MSDISAILADLAAGRIDAAEAERRIQEAGAEAEPPLAADEASAEWPVLADDGTKAAKQDPPRETRARAAKTKAIERVIVKATGRRVKVIGDPSVKTAMAEDIHTTRRRSDTLEISGEVEQLSGLGSTLSFLRSIRGLDDLKALGIGQELSIHVNPALEVDLDVTGGSLATDGVPRLGEVRLTAGVATLNDVAVLSDLVVQAGQATVAGLFQAGRSRLRVESGQLTLKVDPASDVTIGADSRVGHISWDTALEHTESELTVGEGAARIDVGVVIGQATIKLGDGVAPEAGAAD
ncbi:MAG: hypothetical protein LBR33_08145 [Propionibacteriaceae bacterium]|jgi:hypothetical protein|nr:hypothetical protein [Propionibacteriaceae bacterium]